MYLIIWFLVTDLYRVPYTTAYYTAYEQSLSMVIGYV